jgi:outer membrane protein OmpA-like peptidoglycan-associated protein
MSHRRLTLATLVLALFVAPSLAQDVRVYGAAEAVNPADVARILATPEADAPVIKMRSLRLLDDSPAAGKSASPERVAVADDSLVPTRVAYSTSTTAAAKSPSALALPVQFGFDSAEILPTARRQLDALAEGIRMLPATKSVVIEGHTDAAGTAQYNDQLSQRRASSVKQYLVSMYGINPARLHAVGMGQRGLLADLDPYAAENRRVQFRGE